MLARARPRPGSVEVVRCRGAPFLLIGSIRGGQRWPVRVVLRGGLGALPACCGGSQSGEGMSSAGEGSARGVHRGPHASSRPDPRPLAPANSRMSHLQATHPRQAELRAAPPHPAQWGKQQAAQAVRSLVSRYASRCARREVARGAGGPGRVQWVASLRPASSGSAARASAAAGGQPRLISSSSPDRAPRENRSRS